MQRNVLGHLVGAIARPVHRDSGEVEDGCAQLGADRARTGCFMIGLQVRLSGM
jgi:hypothetical protein